MKGSKERKKARMHEKGMRKQRFRSYTYLTRCIIPSKLEKLKVHVLKSRLDKYWANQQFVFNLNSELIGTGGLPVCM